MTAKKTVSKVATPASPNKGFAVIETGGKQYRVSVGDMIKIEKIKSETKKDIIKNVENLSRHIKSYEEYYKKLGISLGTVVNHYTAGTKELAKIDKDVLRITGESVQIDLPSVNKPELVEK